MNLIDAEFKYRVYNRSHIATINRTELLKAQLLRRDMHTNISPYTIW